MRIQGELRKVGIMPSSITGYRLRLMREVQSYFVGDPSSCANWLQGFIDAGARHIALRFATLSPIEQMEHAAEVIIPAIRTRN